MTYSSIVDKYDNFRFPVIEVEVNGTPVNQGKKNVGVSNVTVDLTAGFEASQAVFSLYNCYDSEEGTFEFDTVKNFVLIGSSVRILLGYDTSVTEVFRGVITRVNFLIEEGDVPNIQVTAMDVKAVMMSSRYSKKLKATNYYNAVNEIFEQGIYQNLKSSEVITEYVIDKTPDYSPTEPTSETDKSIEMVAESDYEFLVKVAKKYNFEFFILGGIVYFRRAKADSTKQITITNKAKIKRLSVEYDVTGLVEKVVVRGLDVGKGKILSQTKKNSNKLSQGSKAKALISGKEYVYVDSTAASTEDASDRAAYLMEDIMYRYGTMELDIIGIPDILPGRFIKLDGVGTAVSNEFYVYSVRHTLNADGEFFTRVIGRTNKQGSSMF